MEIHWRLNDQTNQVLAAEKSALECKQAKVFGCSLFEKNGADSKREIHEKAKVVRH
jgi:hypothetical protein